jgi:hypothetical protein
MKLVLEKIEQLVVITATIIHIQAHHLTPQLVQQATQVQQLVGVGLKHMKVQPKGLVTRQFLDFDDFSLHLVCSNRGAGQETKATRIGGGSNQR